ncbi:hypothetical protein N657DRAFT_633064 [Parathielavia appendiculata]|uniref:Uncharacterized protein n=1 Tax=Parathielavia appendiculata TaxID=2587402 RepID=A0AAN6U2J4_9PEZI|nr:hypothetical protein N657DRAFT_633064 [Parathielavia appendiculata]
MPRGKDLDTVRQSFNIGRAVTKLIPQHVSGVRSHKGKTHELWNSELGAFVSSAENYLIESRHPPPYISPMLNSLPESPRPSNFGGYHRFTLDITSNIVRDGANQFGWWDLCRMPMENGDGGRKPKPMGK